MQNPSLQEYCSHRGALLPNVTRVLSQRRTGSLCEVDPASHKRAQILSELFKFKDAKYT